MAYRGSVYTNGFLKVWRRELDSNQRIMVSKTIALTAWLYPNIQTALFIQPTAIGRVYEDSRGNHEYQLRLTQPNAREASSSCTIRPILDVTLPTRLGLRPIALLLPLFTSAILHLLSVLLSHFQPNTDTGHLVLFQDCGSILLAANPEDLIVQETGLISATRLMDG